MRTLLLCLAALPALCAGQDWSFRTIEGQVLGVDGKPAEGEKVLLIGLDRNAFNKLEDAEKNTGWHFTTDQDGKFTARIGRFAAAEHSEKTKQWLPGWGEYFLIVKPGAKHSGGISPRLLNFETNLPPTLPDEPWGKAVVVAEGIVPVTLQLKAGVTLTAKVQDTEGNAVPDLSLGMEHVLSPLSQTGVDAVIFQRDIKTDRHGFAEFRSVYPAAFHLGFEDGPPYWVQTRLGGQWQDGIIDEFDIPPKSREILVGIVVSSQKMFHYYGKVTDFNGKPAAGAQIVLAISQHRRAKTHRDQNDFIEITTGDDGTYSIKTETPWVRGFTVKASGYADTTHWPTNGMLKPGQYNFLLRKPK